MCCHIGVYVSYIRIYVHTYVSLIFPSQDAIKVLDHYRDQFIEEMNANSVVHELYHEKIITDGDHQAITANRSRKEQNSLLHLSLKNCTDEVFKKACQIFIKSGEHGNARMKALGEQMVEAMNEAKKQSLVTGVCERTHIAIAN